MKIKILLFLLGVLTIGCKENDIQIYSDAPRLEFPYSVDCVFSDEDYFNKTEQKEFQITTSLIGYSPIENKNYFLKSTPVETSPFQVEVIFEPSYVFKAGDYSTISKFLVKKPDVKYVSSLKNPIVGVTLCQLDITNNENDFGLGRVENSSPKINVSLDIYPKNWNSEYWGDYSTAKYIFMMSEDGFNMLHKDIEASSENQRTIRTKYNNYLKSHSPLIDDNGESIELSSFPQKF